VLSGAQLSLSGGRIILKKGNSKISIPLKFLSGVVLMGHWSMSSSLTNTLLKARVPLFLLSRYGSFKGVLFADYFSSNYRLRLNQYAAFKNRRVEIASFILLEKAKSVEKFFNLNLLPYKGKIFKEKSTDRLLGLEGSISQKMFEVFKDGLPKNFTFKKREYRPPKDEVNALLSLYYNFYYCLLFPLVLSKGFDPYLSFLHTKRGKHASFCSDVLEPLRPALTYQILQALKASLFSLKDFSGDASGVFLSKQGFSKFLNFFERHKEENLALASEFLVRLEEILT